MSLHIYGGRTAATTYLKPETNQLLIQTAIDKEISRARLIELAIIAYLKTI